jgi:hypothetical protein
MPPHWPHWPSLADRVMTTYILHHAYLVLDHEEINLNLDLNYTYF